MRSKLIAKIMTLDYLEKITQKLCVGCLRSFNSCECTEKSNRRAAGRLADHYLALVKLKLKIKTKERGKSMEHAKKGEHKRSVGRVK